MTQRRVSLRYNVTSVVNSGRPSGPVGPTDSNPDPGSYRAKLRAGMVVGISLHLPSARRQAARYAKQQPGTTGEDRSCP
jgi:hypothetical protein